MLLCFKEKKKIIKTEVRSQYMEEKFIIWKTLMGVFPINLSNINNSINNENVLVLKYTFLLKISDYLTKRNEKKI